MQNNKVFLSPDGVIEIEVGGAQSFGSVTTMGKGAKVKYFDSRDQALGWLKQSAVAGSR